MITLGAFRALRNTKHFRGRTRILRALHARLGTTTLESPYGPLIVANPSDATNFYYLSGTDSGNYDDVAARVRALSAGDAFIDIGANAGLFALMASEKVSRDGVVLAFEPNIHVFKMLIENIQKNRAQNILPLNVAIAGATTRSQFACDSGGHTGVGHLSPEGNMTVWQWNFGQLLPVITDMIETRSTVVKIDVEGAEAVVLRALIPSLSTLAVREIIVEIDSKHLKRFGDTPQDIYHMMESCDFNPLRGADTGGHYNEVFVRKSKA